MGVVAGADCAAGGVGGCAQGALGSRAQAAGAAAESSALAVATCDSDGNKWHCKQVIMGNEQVTVGCMMDSRTSTCHHRRLSAPGDVRTW